MGKEKIEFIDPIYPERIIFEQTLPSDRFISQVTSWDPRDIIKTDEFIRLAYIRQSSLHWLSFPSSSHSYYTNAIGCWRLGRIAETLIKINLNKRNLSLRNWLVENSLRNEYYLSLLLHQIGRSPIESVVDFNDQLNAILATGDINYANFEIRSADLICGRGAISEEWKNIRKDFIYTNGLSISNLINNVDNEDQVGFCLISVLYLILGNVQIISNFPKEKQDALRIIRNVIAGMINLGRLDSYARIAFFSGLSQINSHIKDFFNNLFIANINSKSLSNFIVSREGASSFIKLLFGVRQIESIFFRNHNTIALQSMLDHAINIFLEGINAEQDRYRTALRIVLMDDDTFFKFLIREGPNPCRYLVRRILSMQPYKYVGRWQTNSDHLTKLHWKKLIMNKYNDSKAPPCIVCWTDEDLSLPTHNGDLNEWLSFEKLSVINSNIKLSDNLYDQKYSATDININEHVEYACDLNQLRQTKPIPALWVFALSENDLERIKREITLLLSTGGDFDRA